MYLYRTTTYVQRVAIIEKQQVGSSYHEIAQEMGLSYYTVRKWCRRHRDKGWDSVQEVVQRKQGILSGFHPLIRYVALRLKRQYPGWGLDKILLEMQRRPSLQSLKLPSRSSLHLYYKSFKPRLHRHRPAPVKRLMFESNVKRVHDCWQMDFKGEEDLGQVGKVKPFNVCDAYSSAPLASIVHTGKRSGITMQDVQNDLRQVFSEWGLPQAIRMDRDPLFVGSTRLEFPGRLMLWLVGLGVAPIINRAHRPTDNAQVERCNGIWFEHVARGQSYQTLDEVQQATDQARRDRLEYLPSRNPHCHKQPPLVALPELAQTLISYTFEQEAQSFDMQPIYHYLAQWQWQRLVDSSGQFGFAGSKQRIGYAFCGQVVKLHFDLEALTFVACHLLGHELYRFTLTSLTPESICGTGMLE